MTAPYIPGNIDLTKRPRVKNPDGSISTVRSMSFNEDGREILVPTVSDDGRILSNDDAVALYHSTGKHLGMFPTVAAADSAANAIHKQQARMIEQDPTKPQTQDLDSLIAARRKALAAPSADHLDSLIASRRQTLASSESTAVRPDYQASQEQHAAEPGLLSKTLGTIAATGRDIPGVEAAQAGARALIRRQPYSEALSDIRTAEDAAPGALRFAARAGGGTLGLMATPGSALKAGALYGALNGALQSDPNADAGDRAFSATTGAATGALAGKAGELVSPVLRSLGAPRIDANIAARATERTAQAAPKYADFRTLGDLGQTPALKEILDLPIIRRAIETVKGESPKLNKLPDTDANVLDAVYKRVGSKAWNSAHGFEPGEARSALLDAIESAAQTKGGSYRAALEAYAQPSAGIQAVKRGSLALKNAGASYGTPLSKATTESPLALTQWAPGAAPAERQAAAEGVLGRLSDSPKLSRLSLGAAGIPIPFPSRAVREAPTLLNALGAEDSFTSELAKAFLTQQAASRNPAAQLVSRYRY